MTSRDILTADRVRVLLQSADEAIAAADPLERERVYFVSTEVLYEMECEPEAHEVARRGCLDLVRRHELRWPAQE
jgi:hypothetical protein